jgi:hypothetical protein
MVKNFSSHQQKIIKDYYKNIDKIALARLGELVGNIYLAETQKKKDTLWTQVAAAMKQLKISPAVAEHILQKRDVEILAKNLNEWTKSA